MHENLRTSARSYPDQLAYICQSDRITYADLDKLTDQIATRLQSWGMQKGDRVGVFLNRCIESPLAVYAILKAGGVFVPMDPSAPPERNAYVIKEVGIKYIITHPSQRFHLRKIDFTDSDITGVIGGTLGESVQDSSWDEIKELQPRLESVDMDLEDSAYIMFTSGSTGTPKGIVHSHKSGHSYARLSKELYEVGPEDIIGNHSPLHFDISTFGYFTSVLAGATTVLCTDGHIKMPTSLAQLIDREKMTIWYSVPLALIQMLQSGVLSEVDWSSLRWVLFGGEPFPMDYVKQIMTSTPNATWCNVYGPAEVNQCSYFHFSSVSDEWDQIPLGHIWSDTEYLIEEGELLIASVTQMKGYWKDAERTEQAFYHQDGHRYYRTGDIVRKSADSLLHFIGRKDRQIKVRGYRVELGEIESRLENLEHVERSVAFALAVEDGVKKIAVAILARDAKPASEYQVYLKQAIPGYAVPELYIFVDEIPRTPAGKIDYRALETVAEKEL